MRRMQPGDLGFTPPTFILNTAEVAELVYAIRAVLPNKTPSPYPSIKRIFDALGPFEDIV